MAFARRQPAFEDGLNKKHDLPVRGDRWQGSSRMPVWTGVRRRRVLLVLLALLAVYFFVKYIPTDVTPVGQRIDSRTGQSQGRNKHPLPQPARERPSTNYPDPKDVTTDQIYDGPVKFYNLASTLRSHMRFDGDTMNAVLFTLHDLKSASTLIPLACEMATFGRSEVHVAVMSRQDAVVNTIMEISGVSQLECPIIMHDARPDYSLVSTPERRALAVKGALGHMGLTLRPKAVVTDASVTADADFLEALQRKADDLRIPVTTLPADGLSSMHWISGLSASSLAALDSVQVEILIHAQSDSAGALIQLLQSIQDANYAGVPWPKITIELPAAADSFLLQFLDGYRWPPDGKSTAKMLTLRKRIDTSQLSPAMASLRTLEAFYPATASNSHVLVLSPDIELSPHYLQYLTFALLEYRHGQSASPIPSHLIGISLELPKKRLDDKTKFWTFDQEPSSLFLLSQSPTSNAALYFGDKWSELHSYLQHRVQRDTKLEKTLRQSEVVSEEHPFWLRLALEFMQARGYYMHYPAFARDQDLSLVMVHKELHRLAEEFVKLEDERKPSRQPPSMEKGSILTADGEATHAHGHERPDVPLSLQAMLSSKPSGSGKKLLPEDLELPLYSYQGKVREWPDSTIAALDYGEAVSLELGGCTSLDDRDPKKVGTVEHIFCEER